jgi:hypothetical protein
MMEEIKKLRGDVGFKKTQLEEQYEEQKEVLYSNLRKKVVESNK